MARKKYKRIKQKAKHPCYKPFIKMSLEEFNEKYVNEVSSEIYRNNIYPYMNNNTIYGMDINDGLDKSINSSFDESIDDDLDI